MTDYPEFTPTTEQVRSAYAHDPEAEYRDPVGFPAMQRENLRAFDRWLAAHDAEVREHARHEFCDARLGGVVAEEPEWEYGVGWRYDERLIAFSTHTRAAAEKYIDTHPEDLDFGSHILVQREPEQPAGPWVPVKQEPPTPANAPCVNCGHPGAVREVVGRVMCDACVESFTVWTQKQEGAEQ